jgi:MarR family transcriptional regulator, negative regulator of the multidrug operon emrRAB
MTLAPSCPSFALIESHIGRVAARMRDAPVQDIVLVRLIKALSAQFGAHLSRKVRPAGLNEVAFRTLTMLYANDDGVHPSELSEASGETRTNMTRICDELARKGLIRRRAGIEDRRRIVLELTRRGEKLIERLLPEVWLGLGHVTRALKPAQKKELELLLKNLLSAFEAETGS